jgi:hypothetical protein
MKPQQTQQTKSTVLLAHHLKALKLPTMLAECEKTRHAAWLGQTPPSALIALAWFDHNNSMLLLALGLFGALGYGLALLLLPRIHSAIRMLKVALTPTHQLLYGEPVMRETP